MSHFIRWLHSSDFHVGKGRERHNLDIWRSNFVRYQGGKWAAEQYALFQRDCLAQLEQLVGTDCHILRVPGNHDVDRTQAEFVSRDSIQNSLNFFDPSEQGRQKREAVMPRFQAYHDRILWAQLTPEAVQSMAADKDITPVEAERLLAVTGGHPLLVRECLRHIGGDYGAMLNQSALPGRLFVRYRGKKQDSAKIRQWLQRDVLGPFEHWPTDKLLRRLYWDNLLTERDHTFVWRCELLRQWGIQQLGGV